MHDLTVTAAPTGAAFAGMDWASTDPPSASYGQLWPDADDRTRAATDGLMAASLDDLADSLRTGRRLQPSDLQI